MIDKREAENVLSGSVLKDSFFAKEAGKNLKLDSERL
jgi:hypothetical protein